MSRSKLGVLAISAMVLGLMAIATASAQAKPEWMVNGANITTNTLLPQVQIKEIEPLKDTGLRHVVLLSEILKIKTEFLCTAAELENVKLASGGKTTNGFVKFTGCITKLNGEEAPECKPKSPGAALGTILTNEGLGEIVLHEPSPGVHEAQLLVHPVEGETFVTMELGTSCPVGNKVPVIGELFIKDCNGKFEIEEPEHLIEQGSLTTLWVISKTTEHVSKLDGSAWVKLVSPHEGLKWSGLAL